MIFYRVFRGDNRQMEQLAVYRVLLLFLLQGRHMVAPGPGYSKKKRTRQRGEAVQAQTCVYFAGA